MLEIKLENGIAQAGDDVLHKEFGRVRLAFTEELGMHYLRWGYAGFDKDFENLQVINNAETEVDFAAERPRG